MIIYQLELDKLKGLVEEPILKQLAERKSIKDTEKAYLIDTTLQLVGEQSYETDMFNQMNGLARMKGYSVLMIKKNPTN